MMSMPQKGLLESIRVLRACILSIDHAAERQYARETWAHVLGNIRALCACGSLSVYELAGLMLYANELVPGIAEDYIPPHVVQERLS